MEFPQIRDVQFKTFDGNASYTSIYDSLVEYARNNDLVGHLYLKFVIQRYFELFHTKDPEVYPNLEETKEVVTRSLVFHAAGPDRLKVREFYGI